MFRMLTKKTIKQFPVITVSGIHMGFLCITIFALYRKKVDYSSMSWLTEVLLFTQYPRYLCYFSQ